MRDSDEWTSPSKTPIDPRLLKMSEKPDSMINDYRPELLALEDYPDDTAAMMAALAYENDDGELCARGDMPIRDIEDNLAPSVELNHDQIRYRLENLVGEDPKLVQSDYRDRPDWGPTGYYSLTEDGLYVLSVQELADELFEETDPITEVDIYQILSHLKRTRETAEHMDERFKAVMEYIRHLEQKIEE